MYPEIYGYIDSEIPVNAMGILMLCYFVFYLFTFAYIILAYVLHSVGLHTIAKRRGIRRPWLSWLPVGASWILGCISDQYQYVAKGKIRNRRKLLMILEIVMYALLIFYGVYLIRFVVNVVVSGMADSFAPVQLLMPILTLVGIALVMCAGAVLITVFQYIAYYDLFYSANPAGAVVSLVLSIIFSFLLPIFVFVNRKKELGMPPRKGSAPESASKVVEGEVVEAQEECFDE